MRKCAAPLRCAFEHLGETTKRGVCVVLFSCVVHAPLSPSPLRLPSSSSPRVPSPPRCRPHTASLLPFPWRFVCARCAQRRHCPALPSSHSPSPFFYLLHIDNPRVTGGGCGRGGEEKGLRRLRAHLLGFIAASPVLPRTSVSSESVDPLARVYLRVCMCVRLCVCQWCCNSAPVHVCVWSPFTPFPLCFSPPLSRKERHVVRRYLHCSFFVFCLVIFCVLGSAQLRVCVFPSSAWLSGRGDGVVRGGATWRAATLQLARLYAASPPPSVVQRYLPTNSLSILFCL